jgi:hypothetical protein
LVCWNADGVCGRKHELDHFLGQHGVDICLLTETHLNAGKVFQMANYVCNRTDWLTEGGGTAILVRCGIDHHAVPMQSLVHLEATAIQAMLASKLVKILAIYLSSSWPLIASDLSACLGCSIPVPMASDLNAKHMDWNSRLVTKRGRLA